MGYVEDIEKLELADDVKEQLIRSHQQEVDPLLQNNQALSRRSRKTAVNQEVIQLSNLGFDEAPGLLKFVRRVLLSDDEEPGLVLLSDADLELSGDEATGANGKEELTVAGAIRKFIELMPKSQEGKLNLSDQVHGNENINRPDKGNDDPETKATERAERTERLAGGKVERTRKRYRRATSTAEGV